MKERYSKLFERRNTFYWMMVASGHVIIPLPDGFPVGVAFITAGVVGLVMSFITGEVAEKLYSTIREEGQKTREAIQGIREDNQKTREEIRDIKNVLTDILAVLRDIRNK